MKTTHLNIFNSPVCVFLGCKAKAEYVVIYKENGMNSNPLCHKHLEGKIQYLLRHGLHYEILKFEDDKVKVQFT